MSRFSDRDIEKAARIIDPVFLHSPQYVCETLGDHFGCRVIVKVETMNPVRSFKGRGADLLVQQATGDHLICASAGNFGQAMAYACRKKGIALTVYASEHANAFKVERMKDLGARVILKGADFDEAKLEAKKSAAISGVRFVEDSFDIDTVLGAGTIGLELEQFDGPLDFILVPLGNGALVNGIGAIFKAARPSTKVLAIQAEGAPAMMESWQSGKVVIHERINTIADGIGVRIPVEQALNDMKGKVDDGLLVSDQRILEGMRLLQRHIGLAVEPSAAVGVAALAQHPAAFTNRTVALILTGSNLTAEQLAQWF